MVVPVLEAHERALPAVVEVELGQALEHLGNRIVLAEIQPPVVTVGVDAAAGLADAERIRGVDQVRVGIAQGPVRAQAQGGVGGQ
ncbi:hypothetical protein D3C76_1487960 [compost metagenome]